MPIARSATNALFRHLLAAAAFSFVVITASAASAQCLLAVAASATRASEPTARRVAINNWVRKVGKRYDGVYAGWRHAQGRHVICIKQRAGVTCHVRARPCRAPE